MPEKILIVDDDVDTLRLVGLMLQRQGYQIVAANNGTQGIAMAQNELPDLIILDIMMPDMDGYEVTRQLRSLPSTESIPIIMFTAKSQVDDKVTGFEAGVDDYLTKPTQPRELFAHVKAVLSRTSKSKAAAVAAAPPRERGVVIGIIAAKSGLGVSTLAMNLGATICRDMHKDVTLVELRPGEGSMALELGFTKPEALNNLLKRKPAEITQQEIDKELISHASGFRVLPSSYQPKDARQAANVEALDAIGKHLPYLGDFVLVDLGAGIRSYTEKVLNHCDGVIVVLEAIPFTILRTKALIEDLNEIGFGEGRVTIVLVNRIRTEMQLSWAQVTEQLGNSLGIAFTPAPELVYQAAKKGTPVVIQQPDSLISQQFNKLADLVTKNIRQKV